MRIKSLIIRETNPKIKNVRVLNFCLYGANFIVDKNTPNERETGNSIGKSTVAKIIDLCFSGKSVSSLYTDSETKNKGVAIEKYLSNKKLEAELELVAQDGQMYTLTCSLFRNGYRKINGQKYTQQDYLSKLNEIVFDLKEQNPTFKQLISKFVRINSNSDEHIFKFLSFASNSVYESIYSFLFKLASDDIVALKASLEEELLEYKRISDSYKRTQKLQSIELLEQKLLAIDNEIKNIKERRREYRYDDDYQREIANNRALLVELNTLETRIDRVMTEIQLLDEAILEQQNTKFESCSTLLTELYKETIKQVESVSKSFEDLVAFHNSMIESKIKFLESKKSEKCLVLEQIKNEYNILNEKKSVIATELLDSGFLSEYNSLSRKIEELMREKGEIENSLAIWKENETNISRVSKMLNELAEKSDSAIIDDNISTFNEFFATYTAILYTDSCVIGFNKQQDGEFPIRLGNIGGVGSGKKKGLISAFDLAYYSFAEKKSIICPRFIVHDKMETTDKKQLREIFNITVETKAQLIIPILNEKLDFLTEEQRNEHIILELSNDDKFFKI